MRNRICISALILAIVPVLALAGPGGQTCATAEQFFSNETLSGDTTTYGNPIGAFGPLPSPGNDAIYKFTADGLPYDPMTVTAAGFDSAIFLLATCAGDSGTPIEAAQGTPPYSMPLDNGAGAPLTAGTTYYVVISGNPANSAGPSGTFSFISTVPVSLQTFTVE